MSDSKTRRNPKGNSNAANKGRRRKVCIFCTQTKDKPVTIDYKNVELLRKYVSDRGKILPRRVMGTCSKHQRELTIAIKRARHLALLPFTRD
ncbi:MAG TPA: 30S ribosomal protein S18 [Haloplasmataceae bacterium]